MDKRLRWWPTPYIEAGLIRLEKLGIFGIERSQIVNHIIGEELRRLLESKILKWEEIREEAAKLPPPEEEPGES